MRLIVVCALFGYVDKEDYYASRPKLNLLIKDGANIITWARMRLILRRVESRMMFRLDLFVGKSAFTSVVHALLP